MPGEDRSRCEKPPSIRSRRSRSPTVSARSGGDVTPTIVPAEGDYVNRAVPNDDRIDNKRIFVSPSAVVDVG